MLGPKIFPNLGIDLLFSSRASQAGDFPADNPEGRGPGMWSRHNWGVSRIVIERLGVDHDEYWELPDLETLFPREESWISARLTFFQSPLTIGSFLGIVNISTSGARSAALDATNLITVSGKSRIGFLILSAPVCGLRPSLERPSTPPFGNTAFFFFFWLYDWVAFGVWRYDSSHENWTS